MPWFDVELADKSKRSINIADDNALKAAKTLEENTRVPVYCRLHDELPIRGRIEGRVGEMGYWYPVGSRAVAVRPMKEVYMGGGYCILPAGDWIAL